MPSSLLYIDPTLPVGLPACRETVWVFSGWAHRPGHRLRGAVVTIGAARFAAVQVAGPRLDAEAAQRAEGLLPVELCCGFWGLAVLPAAGEGERLVPVLVLEWDDGLREETALGPVPIGPLLPAYAADGALVAVVMATYNPDPALFRQQIDSLRAQTHGAWICLVQDDGSAPAHWEMILATTAGDTRFRVERNPANLGFYRNFERALLRVPAEAAFVALADQDDSWHEGKLAALVESVRTGATLAFSAMRVIDGAGGVLMARTEPTTRYDSVDSLLMANAVTGCTCLFRASLLTLVLPFPAAGRPAYHDHWIATCGAAAGPLVYVPEPLVDYVQHGANAIGYRRMGLRTGTRIVAALLLAPLIALAALRQPLRRRAAGPLGLLVGTGEGEVRCRAAFAEVLRRRAAPAPDIALAAATFVPPGRRAAWRLLCAMLRPARRGATFRLTAARLLAGVVTAAVMRRVGNAGS
ncbi:glycosyltransferase [Azospirillum sp. sgz301742]